METVIIRKYQPKDLNALKEITYRTGFKGEDLTGRNFIDDKYLFFLIFIAYYPLYEPGNCFVTVDTKRDEVVGFICGTRDTINQERRFLRLILPRIILRVIFYTCWRYPKTLINLLKMSGMRDRIDSEIETLIQNKYPAHLHINLIDEYQGKGLGTKMIEAFEEHLDKLGVHGIHLQTTNHNQKAVPFYKKLGYTILHESRVIPHPTLEDIRLLIFVKNLRS
jgi:ribosomal protein S18 acetylase RimI-like enzyme